MKFIEAQLESAIMELLEAEGYTHVLGEAIERQPQKVFPRHPLLKLIYGELRSPEPEKLIKEVLI